MLSDAKVRAAKPRPKSYKLSDANRLFLLVTPSGGKLWRYSYYYDGKQKTLAFGVYPQVSLSDARVKRDEAASLLAEGTDPIVARKLKIEANVEASRQTFERIARQWYGKCQIAVGQCSRRRHHPELGTRRFSGDWRPADRATDAAAGPCRASRD
jgi:hypothetical protein